MVPAFVNPPAVLTVRFDVPTPLKPNTRRSPAFVTAPLNVDVPATTSVPWLTSAVPIALLPRTISVLPATFVRIPGPSHRSRGLELRRGRRAADARAVAVDKGRIAQRHLRHDTQEIRLPVAANGPHRLRQVAAR